MSHNRRSLGKRAFLQVEAHLHNGEMVGKEVGQDDGMFPFLKIHSKASLHWTLRCQQQSSMNHFVKSIPDMAGTRWGLHRSPAGRTCPSSEETTCGGLSTWWRTTWETRYWWDWRHLLGQERLCQSSVGHREFPGKGRKRRRTLVETQQRLRERNKQKQQWLIVVCFLQ